MTQVTYSATVGQTAYSVPFPYLRESHLQVTLNATPVTDWTIAAGVLTFGGTVTVLEDDVVTIKRVTPTGALLTDFLAASTLRASEIRSAALQLLYIGQEQDALATSVMKKNGAGTAWDGESLPLKALGAPVDATDAVNLAALDSRLATGGVLPEPLEANVGKGIRIRDAGGGAATYSIGSVDGAFQYWRIPAVAPGDQVPGAVDGYAIANEGALISNWVGTDDAIVPLELQEEHGTADGGNPYLLSDVLTFPRGKFEVSVEGQLRNTTLNAGDTNLCVASAALTDPAGSLVYDSHKVIQLGGAGGNVTPGPFQACTSVRLRAVVDVTGLPKQLTLRLSRGGTSGAENVIADFPFRLIIREIPQ